MNKYLIWSEEHGAWWRPNSCGYTKSLKEAGQYSYDGAFKIASNANAHGRFCEVPVEFTAEMRLISLMPGGGR